METLALLFVIAYFAIFLVLAGLGLHRYFLVCAYYRHRRDAPLLPPLDPLPSVTVQLPTYNEVYVVERLIEAACSLDYPHDRLEIQVLDDSSDETGQVARAAVERYRARGVDIKYVRRSEREGYKAGALANGLGTARGELIAVFDADFVPPPGFLMETVPVFADEAVGMAQTRWDHTNRDHSLLTKIQALMLDGHFVIEHAARFFSGCFFNFNGTAGVWRRRCIEEAGGWQHDTLTEDLDLSYRAQLKGWRFAYLPDVTVPAEIPVEMNAFRSQQHRWAKGSIQTARKHLAGILSAPLPLKARIEAVFHLTANSSYLGMAVLAVILYPSILARFSLGWPRHWIMLADFAVFMAATASLAVFYICSQREIGRSVGRTLLVLPALMSLGIGMSINNARAVLEALVGHDTPFVRTPKYRAQTGSGDWKQKKYRSRIGQLPYLELALGIYFTGVVAFAVQEGLYATAPFLMLFQFGYLYTSLMSLLQGARSPHKVRVRMAGDGPPDPSGQPAAVQSAEL